MKKVLFLLTLIFVVSFTQAQDEGIEVKHDSKTVWVTDNEDLFTDAEEAKLSSFISNYEKQTSVEIAVLTTPDYENEADATDYAVWVGETWGVGKEGLDNGLMMVISKANGNDWSVATGYGLEGYLPDLYLEQLRDTFSLILDKGEYYEAVQWYLNECTTELGVEYSAEANEEKIYEDESTLEWMLRVIPWWGWVLIFIVWFIWFLIDPGSALFIVYLLLGSKSDSDSGSFGGGRFGGGGSGR